MSDRRRGPVTCPVCGLGVHPKDPACPACGASLAAEPSLLDELMPGGGARPDDTADDLHDPVDPYAASYDEVGRPVPAETHGADAQPAGVDTGEPYTGEPYPAEPYPAESYGAEPHPAEPHPADAYPAEAHPEAAYPDVHPVTRDAERRSGGGILLPLVLLVVVVLVAVVGWQLFRGGDEDTDLAAPTTSSSESPAGPSSDEGASPSGEESAPTESPSPTESETPEAIERASTSQRCASAAAGATAYRGNDVTTCQFAVETAKALVDADPELPATITSRSPVTDQTYEMECENTSPVVCRGGNDAVVYVDLP